jgi:predicted TIM-barrel fold metal-dependent hydrolase
MDRLIMPTKSYEIRQKLDHPIIDSDGHWAELYPVYQDYVREIGGPKVLEKFNHVYGRRMGAWYEASPQDRLKHRMRRPSYWGVPTSGDRIATLVPRVFRESLDDWGIDVAVVYPTIGLTLPRDVGDPELSTAAIKAYNVMVKEVFAPYADRVIPVGVVSLATPQEAIDQLEHAHSIGLRQVVTGGSIVRPVEADAEWQPDPAKRRVYVDGLGLDSPYDYEPVWRKFVEVGVAVTTHSGSMGWPDRSSPTNFVANHLGHFAQSHHVFARSLFLGGVTQRHPDLNFGFLEGGVGWACNLFSDLKEHWEKRNRAFLDANLKPTNLDRSELRLQLRRQAEDLARYGEHIEEALERNLDQLHIGMSQDELAELDAASDDFSLVDIPDKDTLRRLFRSNFYFGCEADDPMTAIAFDPRMKMHLKPVLGSDIAHFDVVDATEVVEEAYELVEKGLLTEDNFKDFTFRNPIRLFAGMNPDFFAGTILEDDVRAELGHEEKAAASGAGRTSLEREKQTGTREESGRERIG